MAFRSVAIEEIAVAGNGGEAPGGIVTCFMLVALRFCNKLQCFYKEGYLTGNGYNQTRRLCAICFNAPRECIFFPCGHCVSCYECGTK
ncbi:PREDICTED: uncharacterized protein LOC104772813 [Camelina sativa]|uniref:Uncharacterized protein LOC104772813 n=1 Tax=Camelina sativa TaxID=90675 RepID=A0ABM0Y558_CAMSA|nr:PREDICTED: uncharacterized protein LOC104772813 [Camelina sativa]